MQHNVSGNANSDGKVNARHPVFTDLNYAKLRIYSPGTEAIILVSLSIFLKFMNLFCSLLFLL